MPPARKGYQYGHAAGIGELRTAYHTPKVSSANTAITGERDIIAVMQGMLGAKEFVPDDVGYADVNGTRMVVNTDTMVQSTDMPPGMTLRQAARKSIISCISDFAAKGARPGFGTISVNIPKGAKLKDITEMATGFADAACEYNITIVAGDTNAGMEYVFNVCLVGLICTDSVIGRGGASPGDLIFVTGPFGYTALGLEVLLLLSGDGKPESDTVDTAVKSVLNPGVRLDFTEACAKHFTSSMDSSDGLAATLNEMARQSGHAFEIDRMPATQEIAEYARRNSKSLEKMVFHGGEEYETVFTAAPGSLYEIRVLAERYKAPIIMIGVVRERNDGTGQVYTRMDGAARQIAVSGWDHFSL